MFFNRNTKINCSKVDTAIYHAIDNLKRDIQDVFLPSDEQSGEVILTERHMEEEQFYLKEKEGNLVLQAGDTLGFVYGIYEISRRFLGVANFWFWNEQRLEPKPFINIAEGFAYASEPFRVRLRGWFINDEVLLQGWQIDRDKAKPWEMVFEALLRLGGNMVIPGTDKNSGIYCHLASQMGLYITHHHAEPLGAEMFARRYPNLNPSYDEYPELFQGLWKEAIENQRGQKVVWNLGFRGQGDCPFWEHDSRYVTEAERGALISSLIRLQYDLVRAEDPKALCCTNLYGETMELYQKGFMSMPTDVIKIWADNGYGKMVSRRQNNHNPRIMALPDNPGKLSGCHGIYYHASFYDLQAANHMTMFVNSMEFVKKELQQALDRGVDDYWIINCSNVKPHTYVLDFLAAMWKDGKTEAADHRHEYVKKYYCQSAENLEIEERIREYAEYALPYGAQEDEHAGEQFANYTTRMLVSQWMKNTGNPVDELRWAVKADSLQQQMNWYERLCKKARISYGEYLEKCQFTRMKLSGHARTFFEHSILLQAEIYFYCYEGGVNVCQAFSESEKGNYAKAFYLTGKARDSYRMANDSMRITESGKWNGFYENDCLTDMKQTAWVLDMLMSHLRNLGDGPHFYQWQREFLYPESDRRVCLVTNMENHMQNEEIYGLMQEKWG